MKIRRLGSVAILLAFATMPGLSPVQAQSITTGALSSSALCAGDSLSVSYTITGSFTPKNGFTAQLSDSTGSFSTSFINIGSLVKTTGSGTIQAFVPANHAGGSHYRIRVIGSAPYTVGTDNGSDLIVGAKPTAYFSFAKQFLLEGDTVLFTNNSTGGSTYTWDFGDGAIPATSTSASPPPVIYTTPGSKYISLTVTSASGCSQTYRSQPYDSARSAFDPGQALTIYSCSPAIPHEAEVDSVTKDYGTGMGYIWVQPGTTFISQTGAFVVFAEPGSSVSLPSTGGLTVYLANGASYTGGATGNHRIIYADGAGLNALRHETLLHCPTLSFDYTNAPPNKIQPAGVASPSSGSSEIVTYPNPATTLLNVESGSAPSEVTLFNELGASVLHNKGTMTKRLQLNVAEFPAGTYYLRLDFGSRSETRKVTLVR